MLPRVLLQRSPTIRSDSHAIAEKLGIASLGLQRSPTIRSDSHHLLRPDVNQEIYPSTKSDHQVG